MEESYILPLHLMENGKVFFRLVPPTPRYSYSWLAWLYIDKRSWQNKWGPVSGGGMKLNIFTFDIFTLSISIDFRIQWWFNYPDTFVSGRFFRINEFIGLMNRPVIYLKIREIPIERTHSYWQPISCRRTPSHPCWRCHLGRISWRCVYYVSPLKSIHSILTTCYFWIVYWHVSKVCDTEVHTPWIKAYAIHAPFFGHPNSPSAKQLLWLSA